MNPYLEDLINNYYSLTGKPVASMTVAEYLQFASATSVISPLPRQVQTEPEYISESEKKLEMVKPDIKPVSAKSTADKKATVLDMLKSISG